MHESFKSSIIDASVGDLQIAVDEPGGFIYFQLGALFTPPCYRLEYKEDKWDINNDADKSKKKKGRGRKGVGVVVVWGGCSRWVWQQLSDARWRPSSTLKTSRFRNFKKKLKLLRVSGCEILSKADTKIPHNYCVLPPLSSVHWAHNCHRTGH